MNILHISPYVPDVRASHAGGVLMGKTVETLKERNRVFVLTFRNDEKEEEMLKQHPDYAFVRTSRGTYIRKVLQYLWMPNMLWRCSPTIGNTGTPKAYGSSTTELKRKRWNGTRAGTYGTRTWFSR